MVGSNRARSACKDGVARGRQRQRSEAVLTCAQRSRLPAITTLIGTDYFGIHHNEHPALILLDHVSGGSISAPQLAKILREIFPLSPIVVFSGLMGLPSEMKELVDEFIPKGDAARLSLEVRKIAGRRVKGSSSQSSGLAPNEGFCIKGFVNGFAGAHLNPLVLRVEHLNSTR